MECPQELDLMLLSTCFVAYHYSKEIKLNSNGNAWIPNLHIDDAGETVFQCINKEFNNDLNIINVGQDIDNIKIIDIAHIVKKNVPGSKISF